MTDNPQIWDMLENVRRSHLGRDYLGMVGFLRAQNERLELEDLLTLHESAWPAESFAPKKVLGFMGILADSWRAARILDPMGGLGFLGASLAANDVNRRVDVVTPNPSALELIQPLGLANLTILSGSPEVLAGRVAGGYDMVASLGPINRPRETKQYSFFGDLREIVDDPSLLVVLDSASILAPAGRMAFLVTPKFIWDARANSVRQSLGEFGLTLTALLQFRPGTFPGTGIRLFLAIVEPQDRDGRLFVAEVPDDVEAQQALVQRLRRRASGVTPAQGRLVAREDFHGVEALEARDRYRRLGRDKGLHSIPFDEAVVSIRKPHGRLGEVDEIEDDPRAVYLPLMAATKATTRKSELPAKLKSYVQLIVDPKVVSPDYLAGMFNTPLGHALRQSCMTGDTIPRIRPSILSRSALFLPSVEQQRIGVTALQEIQRLRSELSELETTFWRHPSEGAFTLRAVRQINHEERFTDWVETLPLPLAAILRSYHALDRSPKEKYERLLHFFEAFAVFLATLHLSAVRTDRQRWTACLAELAPILDRQHLTLRFASFGTWRAIAELLSARLRAMLRDSNDRSAAGELYAAGEPDALAPFSSAEVSELLQRINAFRNRWPGHGGAVTEAEAAERFGILEADLAKLRELLGSAFEEYRLIEPREAEILDGPTFRCRVRRVMGSNPQLEQEVVDLTTPAVTGRLYMHNLGHDKALELLPFVQVTDAPQPAGFFFNRMEASGAQLVTYQFAAESELPNSKAGLEALVEELERAGNRRE